MFLQPPTSLPKQAFASSPWYLTYDKTENSYGLETDEFELVTESGNYWAASILDLYFRSYLRENRDWSFIFPDGTEIENVTITVRTQEPNSDVIILHTFDSLHDFYKLPDTHPEYFI